MLLAHADPVFLDDYLSRPLSGVSDRTITDPRLLRQRLDQVRGNGYAVSRDQLRHQNGSISLPILMKGSVVVAALSAVLPLSLIDDPSVVEEQRRLLGETALTISESLGWRAYHDQGVTPST